MNIIATQEEQGFKPVKIIIEITSKKEFDGLFKIIANTAPATFVDTPSGSKQCKEDEDCKYVSEIFLRQLFTVMQKLYK